MNDYENLLEETLLAMTSRNKTPQDIVLIGSKQTGHRCTWLEYTILANYEYDGGYGGAEVALDLVIVFNDGSEMSRGEYDGSEWWEWHTPYKEKETKKIYGLFPSKSDSGWGDSLEDCDPK